MSLIKRHYQKDKVASTRIIRKKGKKNDELQKEIRRI